jgi:uncharacterized protein
MYANGNGVTKDSDAAVKWYRLAAQQGNTKAQTNLGVMYVNGNGVPKDYDEAVKWYRLAAKQGDAKAQAKLGLMYTLGYGVPKDYDEAVKWFRLAAKQGDALGEFDLGLMYALGQGVPKDGKEAFKWYQLAAAQGDAQAQTMLGSMYENGGDVPKDNKEAFRWFRLAAEQGDAIGEGQLGIMYENGLGVPEDDKEAIRWYRLAAAQGDARAEGNLGRMYLNGQGVPHDYVRSYMWLTVAKKTNVAANLMLQAVVPKMNATQIAQAQEMAKRCEDSSYKQCAEPQGDQFGISAVSAPMQLEAGIYVVPVLINDAITLNFIVDSGAADVSIPADVVMTLIRTGTLKETDFLGEKTYVLADGSKVPSQTFRIRSLKVGNKVLENVNGSIAPVQGSLLLGQSFLNRFKSWSVDNAKHVLMFE